jgi:hypothetical protein
MPSSATRLNGERNHGRRGYGQSVFRDILSLLSSIATSGKHLGVQKIFAVAEATRTFGNELNEVPQFKAYTAAAANGLEDFGDYVERTEVVEILDDTVEFAKRQPVITAAFALAAGIVLTQLVRNWRTLQGNSTPRSRSRTEPRSNSRRMH